MIECDSGLGGKLKRNESDWLYVDSFDSYKLKFYNDTGGTLRTPALRVAGTKTNKR